MKYAKISGLEKEVSKLVFGTATPKIFAAAEGGEEEKQAAYALLDMVFEAGINTFDCAAHYGEEVIGDWMQLRSNRDKCVIITKCAHPNKWRQRVNDFDILSDAHDSLKKLKTDYIDIYMLHRDNASTPVGEVINVMNRLYNEGKIRVLGVSNWTHKRIEAANHYASENELRKFSVSSPNFGLAEQVADPWKCDARFGDGCVTISGPENREAREWYAKHKMPVFAYSSLARGFFSGAFESCEPEKAKEIMDQPGIIGYYCKNNIKRLERCEILAKKKGLSVAQIAMAWIYNQSFEVFALSSPVTETQLMQNIEAMNVALSPREVRWLNLEEVLI